MRTQRIILKPPPGYLPGTFIHFYQSRVGLNFPALCHDCWFKIYKRLWMPPISLRINKNNWINDTPAYYIFEGVVQLLVQ